MTSSAPAQLERALAGRYAVQRELGRGGSAVVYLARDLKHARDVAIKVVAPELSHSIRAERFLQEIQTTARLTHPHILMLIDSGEASGFLYYVMPYMTGESLRERLKREQQLPLDDCLQIAQELAEALEYAHEHGVIHCDVKPENILLHEGHVVVADFGIAHALHSSGAPGTELAAGTPAYMSPEQAGGTSDLDARSDVYSFGCVVYEMLAGRPPFVGTADAEVLARHALDPVPSLRAARQDVSGRVDHVVMRALNKAPVARFETAAAFAAALTSAAGHHSFARRHAVSLIIAAFVFLAGAALAARWWEDEGSARGVAVKSFVNLSRDSADVSFSEGMSDEIMDALGQVDGIRAVRIPAAYLAAHNDLQAAQLGRELNVGHLLEGSVRRDGNRLRVAARLINARNDSQEWSEIYTREPKDVFAVQEGISNAIVQQLQVTLRTPVTAFSRRASPSIEAYELYLKGRYYYNHPPDGYRQAAQYFEAAIGKDSMYALAYAGLADSYIALGSAGYAPRQETYPKGKAAALKAVVLDSTLAETYAALGLAYTSVEWNWGAAERAYRRAVALSPRYADARARLGQALSFSGRFTEAVREGRAATELDPLSVEAHQRLAQTLYLAGRNDEAIDEFRTEIALDPDVTLAHSNLGSAYLQKGEFPQALQEFQTALRLQPGRQITMARLAVLDIRTGKRAEAQAILDSISRNAGPDRLSRALILTHMGQFDRAIELLEPSVGPLNASTFVLLDPLFAPLRKDPRWVALMSKAGLPL